MNNKLKLFLENFLFYGGLSILQKALPFITLPIITKLLPNSSSYGIADMFNLIISFGSAVAILGMYDAIFREFFEDKENKEYQKKVTSTGFNIVLLSSIVILVLIFLLNKKISLYLFNEIRYEKLVILSGIGILISSLNSIAIVPTRMRNKRKVFFITGISFPAIGFLITYFYIMLGYTYEALIYGTILMNSLSLIVFLILNYKDFSLKIFDKKIAKELFKIGIPLVPTFLIYWIFNSMDRIMINKMIGSAELGIYSVGSKVSSVSQLIYSAFAGGWCYFSFSTMKEDKQVKLISNTFEYLGIVSFIAFIISKPFILPVFNLFFSGDYIRGQEVFSYLFLSPLILMLFQTIGSQVIIIKKSYLSTLVLSIGAVFNIVLNFIFIQSYGIRGAAFSTLISYIISVFFIGYICLKKDLLVIKKRFYIISLLLFINILINFFFENLLYIYSFIYILVLILIVKFYFEDLKLFLTSWRKNENTV